MVINPVGFSNTYHNNASEPEVEKAGKSVSKKERANERQIFSTVVKESVSSIMGNKWYLNMELGMQLPPSGYK